MDAIVERVAGRERQRNEDSKDDDVLMSHQRRTSSLISGQNVTNNAELVQAEAQFAGQPSARPPSVLRRTSIGSVDSAGNPRRITLMDTIRNNPSLPAVLDHIPVVVSQGHPEYGDDKHFYQGERGYFDIGPEDDTPPAGLLQIRIIGIIMLVFAFIEAGLGGGAFGFIRFYKIESSVNGYGYGAWWSAPFVMAAAIFAIVGQRRLFIMLALIFGLLALTPLVVGAVYDGAAGAFFQSMKACVGETNLHRFDDYHVGTCYGDQKFCDNMGVMCELVPYADTWKMLGDDYFFHNRKECYCTDGVSCYNFYLTFSAWKHGNYCGDIIVKLPAVLQSSVAFCVMLFVATMFLVVYCMYSLCCGKRLEPRIEAPQQRPRAPYERVRREDVSARVPPPQSAI